MKLRILLSIAFVAMLYMQTNAQNVATPSNGAANMEAPNSDYVTVGSRVPYYSQTDLTIQAMTTAGTMGASIFKWSVTTPADVAVPGYSILNYAGAAATEWNKLLRVALPGSGYFDNEISLGWATPTYSAGTQYKVKVSEKSVTLSGTIEGCEDLTPEVKDVYVLAKPTVAFIGTEGGGCTVLPASTYFVPLTITGLGDWQVTYTVSVNGGAASAPANYTLTVADPFGAVNDGNVLAQSILARTANGTAAASTDGLSITLGAQYGYYDVAITNITDRISRKSLDVLAAAGAAGSFRIYVNPVPATSPIQHVKNL